MAGSRPWALPSLPSDRRLRQTNRHIPSVARQTLSKSENLIKGWPVRFRKFLLIYIHHRLLGIERSNSCCVRDPVRRRTGVNSSNMNFNTAPRKLYLWRSIRSETRGKSATAHCMPSTEFHGMRMGASKQPIAAKSQPNRSQIKSHNQPAGCVS